jgi:hypothetical protein
MNSSARRWLAGIGVVTGCSLVLPLVVVAAWEFLAVDRCLDAGGSFDYRELTCDFSESHSYVAFPARRPELILAGIVGSGTFIAVIAGFAIVWLRNPHRK